MPTWPTTGALEFRIGINVGDIVEQDGDIFGDGVNIAARLEGIAEPGGICVSARVQEDAAGKIGLTFEDMGEQALKNIARPVRAYRLRADARRSSRVIVSVRRSSLPDKPSIAVLPFQNMSGDAEQDYFADGIVEDIITALSRFKSFAVIARNSSFVYKGRAVDVRQVAKELGVRYVLEGSVRRAGQRLRITAQLIDGDRRARIFGPTGSTAPSRTSSTCRTGSPKAWSGSSSRKSGRPRSNARGGSARKTSMPTISICRALPKIYSDATGGQRRGLRAAHAGDRARAELRAFPRQRLLGALNTASSRAGRR